MPEFNPEIDVITKEVTECILKIGDHFRQMQSNLRENYDKGAAIIAYRLGLDYFATARDALHKGRVVSGGAVTRCAFENLVDILYVYDKPEKYPRAYVESMEEFRKLMVAASQESTDNLANSRCIRQANRWTNATIDDRIKASGNAYINLYDILSYFGHPNPGSLTYVRSELFKARQLNLLKQANCMTALALMMVVLSHTDVKSVNKEDLKELASRLGMPL